MGNVCVACVFKCFVNEGMQNFDASKCNVRERSEGENFDVFGVKYHL